jgi:NADP-dependent 3-hydroxy acid dehydrogenase YdfG
MRGTPNSTRPVGGTGPEPRPDPPLAGLVAVVTGASSGIGRAIALALAAQRACVCLVGRDRDRLAAAARDAGVTSPRVLVQQAELGSAEGVDDRARRLHAELPRVDVLVHAAGIHSAGSHADGDVRDLDLQYAVNVRTPFRLTQALLPLLRASRGQVVFVNSSAGHRAGGANGMYAATKHALRALADSLREEVNGDGIRVLSVYPGRVATPIQRELSAREGRSYDPEVLLQPQDVAAIILGAISLPPTAEVTDISLRPMRKPG